MSLGMKTNNDSLLKLKTRDNEIKKVMVYGLDGTGKSTFAEEYCTKNKLNAIVIDIDNTNFTNLPIIDLDISTDLKAYNNIKNVISEISKSNYDTIIIDGVSSLLELLTSKANGMKAYKDRADRFSTILQALNTSGKNIILIGQADMEVIYNDEYQSPKPIIKVNSIVNEKYYTFIEKGVFSSKVVKFREHKKSLKNNDLKIKGE